MTYYITAEQRSKRRTRVLIASLLSISGFIGGIALAVYEQFALMGLSFGLFLVALILAVIFSNTIRIAKVKGQDFYLKGAGAEYLKQIERNS